MKDLSCTLDTMVDFRSSPRRPIEEQSIAFKDAITTTKHRIEKAFEQRGKFAARYKNS